MPDLYAFAAQRPRYAAAMDEMDVDDAGMSEAEALLAGLLEQLWRMAQATPSRSCSLARVSKRTRRPMSVLMRQLGLLSDAGWVEVAVREEGGGSVALSPAGRSLCAGWFGVHAPGGDIGDIGDIGSAG